MSAVFSLASSPELFGREESRFRDSLAPLALPGGLDAPASHRVADRYGGTHLGPAVVDLVRGPHGSALRGAVAVIASDGWDADPPEVLERAMRRLRGRAERVVWLNPRAAATGFVPTAASMAAAMLPASVTSSGRIRRALDIGSTLSRGVRMVATTFQPLSRKRRAVASP